MNHATFASIADEIATLAKTLFSTPVPDIGQVTAILERPQVMSDQRLLGLGRSLLSWGYFGRGEYELMLTVADEAISAFESLCAADRQECAAAYSQALRASGDALVLLDRLTEGLPRLAKAVHVAQIGVARLAVGTSETLRVPVQRAHFHALLSFAIGLFNMEDFDTAIDVYAQTFTITPPADKHLWPTYESDRMIARINSVEVLHERAMRRQYADRGAMAEDDLATAQLHLDAEAWRLEEDSEQNPYRVRYGQPMYYGAWGKQFLLTGKLDEAKVMFEREAAACTLAPVDNEARTNAQIGLASVALGQNRPGEALASATQALESLDARTTPNAYAEALGIIAKAHRALGSYEAAYEALEASSRLRLRTRPMAGTWNSAYKALIKTVDELTVIASELEAQSKANEILSTTDELTQLANRRKFESQAAIEVSRVERHHGEVGVVIFDIDRFKNINDTYGHAVGDTVLQHVAKIAQAGLRPADFIARIGGEEFALLLPESTLAESTLIAQRIRQFLADAVIVRDKRRIRVTASFGVAQLTARSESFACVLELADAALYRAKQSGRNQVCHEVAT
jgi:diguanylate cyclase (GGDEF)-like protein